MKLKLFDKMLIAILTVLFSATAAWGAGSSTTATGAWFGDTYYVTVSFTADDGDGSIPDLTISSSTNAVIYNTIKENNLFLYAADVVCNTGGTEVTDSSEFYVYMKSGGVTKAIDLMDGQGVDALSRSANERFYPQSDGQAMVQRPYDTITVDIDQQAAATNSAAGTITLVFIQ